MEDVEDIYELSPMQHGMLFDSVTADDSGMYLIQLEYYLKGRLRLDELERAWAETIARHPVLRTSFHWEDIQKPLQVVHRKARLSIACEDWKGLEPAEQERRLEQRRAADRARGVDFEEPPLMRLALYELEPESWCLAWSFHHILMEGWSASLVLREVLARYRHHQRGGQGNPELSQHRPYRDYLAWIQQQDPGAPEAYWRAELRGFSEPTHLTIDRSPTVMHAPVTEFDGVKRILSREATAALQDLAQRHELTLNTLVQGAWALLLSCYADSRDVVFGTIVSGRSIPLEGVESMIGLFVNLLPSRVQVDPEQALLPWLRELQAHQVRQRELEYSSLAQVKSWSEVPAGLPLFESILVFENWSGDLAFSEWDTDLEVSTVDGHHGGPGYPMAVVVIPAPEMTLGISFDVKRFEREAVERLLGSLEVLLGAMAADPERRLGDLPLLGPDERQRVLFEWNRTDDLTLPAEPLHRQIEAQARRQPEAVAVRAVGGGPSWTYRQLDQRANRLAHVLAEGQGWVGLCLEREPDLVAGALAAWKAGRAYVPLDPGYPPERLRQILGDARLGTLVSRSAVLQRLGDLVGDATPLDLEREAAHIEAQPDTPPEREVSPEAPAYMIYTSGSTGRPKGVVVPHRALANYVGHARRAFELRPSDRVLQLASISFDTAAEEIYPTLVCGATVVLRDDEMLGSVAAFLEACQSEGITVIDFPTAYWHAVVDGLPEAGVPFPESVRLAILGGERARPEHLSAWFESVGTRPRLFNTYGPTEATIVATACALEPSDERAPIGRPVSNVRAYVLDARLNPVPIGVAGELCLGGAGIATGYHGAPELTAERFVPDPYSQRSGARLYRTGDRVRHLPDGRLEFLGRTDRQVKLRGYRIEPSEIEAALSSYEGVGEAVVLLREDTPGAPRLVAYVVAQGAAPSADALRQALGRELPAYMVPSAIVFLERLPLSAHGKLDTDALPPPDRSGPERGSDFVLPRNELEQCIAGIWQEVLEVDRVGVYDNFFDLGGHSLLLMSVIGKIKKSLGVRLAPGDLVLPTLGQLAALCQERLDARESNRSEGLMKKLARAVRRMSS